jgi:hypothetical protein
VVVKHVRFLTLIARLKWIIWRITHDERATEYTDLALTPACAADKQNLELFNHATVKAAQ